MVSLGYDRKAVDAYGVEWHPMDAIVLLWLTRQHALPLAMGEEKIGQFRILCSFVIHTPFQEEVPMAASQQLSTLFIPCNSGMCPALYTDEQGRMFVQGSRLTGAARSSITVGDHEDVVEVTPELIAFIRG